MIDALNTALSGMKSADSRVGAAANTIVRAGAAASSADGTPEFQDPAVIDATGSLSDDSLLKGVIDLQQAAAAYKANIKVAETADDMQKTLLDALR